jgi:hypothetical protein
MCSTSIASESMKQPALPIRGGDRIIIDCRWRIYGNRSVVEENMARGDRHGGREAKKKPKIAEAEGNRAPSGARVSALRGALALVFPPPRI